MRNDYIKINKYSRPGTKLTAVKKLVVHWTANPGASAANHQKYFNNLTDRYASAHIFIDSKEAICIIPLNEVAYHANDGSYRGVKALQPNANYLSIGVELCPEKDGSFHPNTITQAVQVFADLCKTYKLTQDDIVRHYDVTHKNCPAPWVKDDKPFIAFKNAVRDKLNVKPPTPQPEPVKPLPFKIGNYARAVKVEATSLNVRSGRGTEFGVIGSLKKGQVVTVMYILPDNRDGKGNDDLWGSVTHNGKTGYIHLDYVQPI